MSIFVRNILIDLDEIREGVMRVRASIKDVVHDITLILFVTFPQFEIIDVELEMNETPEKTCPLFKELLGEIKGMTIGKGFNSQIRKIFRGKTGCPTVTGLLTVAAPLAINISWFIERKKRGLSDDEYLRLKRKMMKDKCIAFSSDSQDYEDISVTSGEKAIQRDCENCVSPGKNDSQKDKVVSAIENMGVKYKIPEKVLNDIIGDISLLVEDKRKK